MEDEEPAVRKFLSEIAEDDTLTISEISEKLLYMKKTQEIERKYKDKIKTRRNDGRPYIYINRKQIVASSYEELIVKLYELEHGKANSSLADLYPQYLIWRRDEEHTCSKTLREYTNIWNSHLKDEPLTHVPLVELTVKDFKTLFRKWTRDRNMTRKKFNNIKSLINGIYYFAIDNDIISANPVREINYKQFTFKAVNNNNDVFTIEERRKLLNHLSCNDNMYALAISLAFHLVIRIGELLALRWNDIEGDSIHIQSQLLTERKMNDDLTFGKHEYITVNHVKGNTDKGFRYLPLSNEAKKILAKIRMQNPNGEFILMKDNKQLTAYSFNRWLKKYCEECNVSVHTSHKIRFCVASLLYLPKDAGGAGLSLPELQKLLGHTTSAMSLHYLRQVTPSENTLKAFNEVL